MVISNPAIRTCLRGYNTTIGLVTLSKAYYKCWAGSSMRNRSSKIILSHDVMMRSTGHSESFEVSLAKLHT